MSPFEARELTRRLRAAYPDPRMEDETFDLYVRMLMDLDYARTDEVVDELVATMMKLPTISRVRRAIIEPDLDIPTTEEAWTAIQTHEKDPHELVIRAAHLLGGMYNIRTSADPELSRVRFANVYDRLYRKAVDKALADGIKAQRMQLPRAS